MALKSLKPGAGVQLDNLSNESHQTSAPGRFSEVLLVKKLSELDIGRPSTYSSIVSLIQDRGYVAKKGTQLYPTPLGFAVARLLAAKLPTFTAYDYTAQMETELDKIAEGKQTRVKFLEAFWNGKNGFEKLLEGLLANVDFKEIEQYSRIDLHNGFSIRFSKFGTFLQDDNGKADEKGYLPSARIDDDSDVWDYREAEFCREVMEKSVNKVEAKELGVLTTGEYKGWVVWARDGKFGPFLQAIHPDQTKAVAAGKKPGPTTPAAVNHPLPEGVDLDTVVLKDVSGLFAEVKLPRWSPDKKWLIGIGKRGPYMGKKSSPRARPVFRSLPEEFDPRTVEFSKVEELWKIADAKKTAAPVKKVAAKKVVQKKTAPKTK